MNFSPDSRFMRLCGSFVSLVRINLLWLLCSLPLFTVGASTAAMVSALTAFRAVFDVLGIYPTIRILLV